MTSKTITITEAAERTGHSPDGLRRRAQNKGIPGAYKVGRQWFIPRGWAENPANANPGRGRPRNDGE